MITWQNIAQIPTRGYVCAYCNYRVEPASGWRTQETKSVGNQAVALGHIHACSQCGKPTFFDSDDKQHPSPSYEKIVGSVPDDVLALYNEARASVRAKAFTSAVLTSRKLLMHLAVVKGAEPGRAFFAYVEYLADKGYVPPGGMAWVDRIREKGIEANHEIKIILDSDARELIVFSEMLLKFIYEFPSRVQPPQKTQSNEKN